MQYCSKECQVAHRPAHKHDCTSLLIKETWKPSWHMERRQPAFIGSDAGNVSYGNQKYLWGNVPAVELLNLKDNESDVTRKNFRLLFAGKDAFPSKLCLYHSLTPSKLPEIHEIFYSRFSDSLKCTRVTSRRLLMTEILISCLEMWSFS